MQAIRGHALLLLATCSGILGMGMAFDGAMHGNIYDVSRGVPFLLLGLWWAGRELGRSMLASSQRRPGGDAAVGKRPGRGMSSPTLLETGRTVPDP